jgi:hypothetical protein
MDIAVIRFYGSPESRRPRMANVDNHPVVSSSCSALVHKKNKATSPGLGMIALFGLSPAPPLEA